MSPVIIPVFGVTWSFKNILICRFGTHETFLIIINVENFNIFMQTDFFAQIFWWTEILKELILFIRMQAVLQAVLFKV